jgi:hypothetical protein
MLYFVIVGRIPVAPILQQITHVSCHFISLVVRRTDFVMDMLAPAVINRVSALLSRTSISFSLPLCSEIAMTSAGSAMSPHARTAGIAVGSGPDPNVFPHSPDTVDNIHPNPTRQAEFNHALQIVKKIKKRFAHETGTYEQFLEVLWQYQKEQLPYPQVGSFKYTMLIPHADVCNYLGLQTSHFIAPKCPRSHQGIRAIRSSPVEHSAVFWGHFGRPGCHRRD